MRRALLLVVALAALGGGVSAQPFTITGKVLGPDGRPVAGAVVETLRFYEHSALKRVDTTTAVDGTFALISNARFAFTSWIVVVHKPGLAMALAGFTGAPLSIRLTGKCETRSGLVLGPDGKPMAGAEVQGDELYYSAGNLPRAVPEPGHNTVFWYSEGHLGLTTKTDARGRFSFPDFPHDWGVTVRVTAEGCAYARRDVPGMQPVTVRLQPAAVVSGKVTAKGQPIAGVTVMGFLHSRERVVPDSAVTAADGTYTLSHLYAGQTIIVVSPPPLGFVPAPRQVVNLKAGERASNINFALSPGAIIRGQITDVKTGRPVAQASVSARPINGQGSRADARAGGDGRYQLRVAAGTYVLQATAPSYDITLPSLPLAPAPTRAPGTLTVKEGDVVGGRNLTVRSPRQITVQVLLPDGQPAARAQYYIVGGMGRVQVTKADGIIKLRLPSIPKAAPAPGPNRAPPPPSGPALWLSVRDAQESLCAVMLIDKLTGHTTLTMQPAATAAVHVIDKKGQPVPGARVEALMALGRDPQSGWMTYATAEADRHGLARLTCLPAGQSLTFQPDWSISHLIVNSRWPNVQGEPQERTYILKPGEALALPDLIFDPQGRSVKVFVGDQQGRPIKGALVYAQYVSQPFVTDAKGKVSLTKLALKGKVPIFATDSKHSRCAMTVVDPDERYWPGLLLKPLGTATGVLVGKADGKPLEGVTLTAQPRNPGALLWLPYQVSQELGVGPGEAPRCTTDAEGHWRLGKLIPGLEYSLIAWRKSPRGGEAGRGCAEFKATAGPAVQNLGRIECDVPPGK